MKHMWKGLLLSGAVASVALAQGHVPGEKWKVTTSMQMSGMSMPGRSMEICKAANDDAVPVKADDNCQIYDVKRDGNTQSFKMRCTGEQAMEGSAQITYQGADRYQGKMQVNMQGQSMTMAYDGQKLPGTCDAGAMKREADRMIAQSQQQQANYERQQAEMCHKLAADASAPSMMGTQCKDPADIKTYCSAVRNHDTFEGFSKAEKQARPEIQQHGMRPLSEASQLCGFAVEDERVRLCDSAEANGKLRFIANECPVHAAAIARAQCAGRRYTSISDTYRGFCAEFASNQQQEQQRAEEQTPIGKTKGLLEKGKKAFGLFNN